MQFMDAGKVVEALMEVSQRIAALENENMALRAALAFYADDDNWRLNGPLDANSGNFTGGPAKEILER